MYLLKLGRDRFRKQYIAGQEPIFKIQRPQRFFELSSILCKGFATCAAEAE